MIAAITTLTLLGAALGLLLALAARRFHVEKSPVEEEVAALLPGTNCGQCGFPGCAAAAAAIVSGAAPLSLCPPGGRAAAEAIAARLGVAVDLSSLADAQPRVALVNEALCIGCIKCFRECPTDAVVGAPKQIHVVMWEACTGCGKCVEVCPTESVSLVTPPLSLREWRWSRPQPSLHAA